jgi:hypothetical protein
MACTSISMFATTFVTSIKTSQSTSLQTRPPPNLTEAVQLSHLDPCFTYHRDIHNIRPEAVCERPKLNDHPQPFYELPRFGPQRPEYAHDSGSRHHGKNGTFLWQRTFFRMHNLGNSVILG